MLTRVVRAIESVAPLSLAESWDNTGLLIESPVPRKGKRVFLTIDLTRPVLQEAIRDENVGMIISYHPPLFSSFKRLCLADDKQRIALECAASGISVYSPHTALDSCDDGINDWLARGVAQGSIYQSLPIIPSKNPPAGQELSGSGRIVTFTEPVHIDELTRRIKKMLNLKYVRRAKPSEDKLIKTVAICAGSGGSLLGKVSADLYLTGEMGHHEVLAAVANGTSVILCEHSNTERGYLLEVLKPKLASMLRDDGIDIVCSNIDKDPLEII